MKKEGKPLNKQLDQDSSEESDTQNRQNVQLSAQQQMQNLQNEIKNINAEYLDDPELKQLLTLDQTNENMLKIIEKAQQLSENKKNKKPSEQYIRNNQNQQRQKVQFNTNVNLQTNITNQNIFNKDDDEDYEQNPSDGDQNDMLSQSSHSDESFSEDRSQKSQEEDQYILNGNENYKFFDIIAVRKYEKLYRFSDFNLPGNKQAQKLMQKFMSKYVGKLQQLTKRYQQNYEAYCDFQQIYNDWKQSSQLPDNLGTSNNEKIGFRNKTDNPDQQMTEEKLEDKILQNNENKSDYFLLYEGNYQQFEMPDEDKFISQRKIQYNPIANKRFYQNLVSSYKCKFFECSVQDDDLLIQQNNFISYFEIQKQQRKNEKKQVSFDDKQMDIEENYRQNDNNQYNHQNTFDQQIQQKFQDNHEPSSEEDLDTYLINQSNPQKKLKQENQQYQKRQQKINEKQLINEIFESKNKYWGEKYGQEINTFSMKGELFKIGITEQQEFGKRKQIIQDFGYYNDEIISKGWKQKREKYDRIEINLNDRHFFNEKLSFLQIKFTELQKIQKSIKQQNETREENFQPPDNDTYIKGQVSIIERKSVSFQYNPHQSQNMQTLQNSVIDNQSEVSKTSKIISQSQITDHSKMRLGFTQLDERNQSLNHFIQDRKKNFKKSEFCHSVVANEFKFNNFRSLPRDYALYHRYDMQKIFKQRIDARLNDYISINIVKSKSNVKKRSDFSFDMTNEILDSHEKFQNLDKLSCKKDFFALFEYMEENPLVLSNLGMNSKLYRYVYDERLQRILQQEQQDKSRLDQIMNRNPQNSTRLKLNEEIENFKNYILQKFGDIGSVHFLDENEKIPLIGELTDERLVGIAIIENKLFKAPVFKHKLPKTDFLLVRESDKLYLRRIDHIFTVGQIEPSVEVFSPHSRHVSQFMKNCSNTVIKQQLKADKEIDIDKVKQYFPSLNEQIIRTQLKELNAKQSYENNRVYTLDSNTQNLNDLPITPEDACLFEKMLNSKFILDQFGLKELTSPDKMKSVLGKYIRNYPDDLRGYTLVKVIWDELNLTSWSLSSSFYKSFYKKEKMYLQGIGDPTNGHGGYSYVKKPLKTRTEKYEIKQKAQDKPKVSGTDYDLRHLNQQQAKDILRKLGKSEEHIQQMSRWTLVKLIMQMADEIQEGYQMENMSVEDLNMIEQIKQYKRVQRVTSQRQRINYQKEINRLFEMQIQNLTATSVEEDMAEPQQKAGSKYIIFEDLIEKERPLWEEKKKKIQIGEEDEQNNEEDEEDDTEMHNNL